MSMNVLMDMGIRFAVIAIVIGLLLTVGFHIVYKYILKKDDPLNYRYLVKVLLFIMYMIVVFLVTMIGNGERNVSMLLKPQLSLFASYKQAWYAMSMVQWRNIILNILMFVPMGLFLPMVFYKCKTWWITYGAGLLFSLSIEITQLITHRGLCEMDDLFNNTLGCVIGYGVYVCLISLYNKAKKKDNHVQSFILFQLPFLITVCAFTSLYFIYEIQELGNLKSHYTQKIDMSSKDISIDAKLSSQNQMGYVYQTQLYNQEERREIGESFLHHFGVSIDDSNSIIDDETSVFKDRTMNYSLWVNEKGGTLDYNNFTLTSTDGLEGLNFVELKVILQSYGIELPSNMSLYDAGNGVYELTASFIKDNHKIINGTIKCRMNTKREIISFTNNCLYYDAYKEYELISQQEAYEMIQQGKFSSYYQEYYPDELHFTQVISSYELDSKGFYQPIYVFQYKIEGIEEIQTIFIPAIK